MPEMTRRTERRGVFNRRMATSVFALVVLLGGAFYVSSRLTPNWNTASVTVDAAVREKFASRAGFDPADSVIAFLTLGTRDGVEKVATLGPDRHGVVRVALILRVKAADGLARRYDEMRVTKGADGLWTPVSWKSSRQDADSVFWTRGPTQ